MKIDDEQKKKEKTLCSIKDSNLNSHGTWQRKNNMEEKSNGWWEKSRISKVDENESYLKHEHEEFGLHNQKKKIDNRVSVSIKLVFLFVQPYATAKNDQLEPKLASGFGRNFFYASSFLSAHRFRFSFFLNIFFWWIKIRLFYLTFPVFLGIS